MRHFLRLSSGVNVVPLLHCLQNYPELWNENSLRTLYPNSPHADADDIWLRFNDRKDWEQDPARVMNDLENVFYPAWGKLTPARPIVFDLLRLTEGVRLGRVMITRLAPGKRITPHADGGLYAEYYRRYHVILQSQLGTNIRSGDETLSPRAGDVYWFDNLAEHEVINNGADDRIVMIVDIHVEKTA